MRLIDKDALIAFIKENGYVYANTLETFPEVEVPSVNIIESKEIRSRLREAFPKFFISGCFEVIIHPQRNSYFLLDGVETERQLNAKILEWLSREAIKGGSRQQQKYHFDGINDFLGTNFAREEMELIYTYLGNCCNHAKTLKFIDSGYDITVLKPQPPKEAQ